MRTIAIAFLTAGLAVTTVCTAFATTLVNETFTYPDGDLAGNGGWGVYSGTPPIDVQVSAGRAVLNMANAPDDHLLFTPQATTDKTYACFKVRVTDPGGTPKNVYFTQFKDAGASNFVSRVYVIGLTAGGWTFGLSHSSTSATVGVVLWSTTSLVYDQDYVVAINYDPVAKSSTMWVNPADESSPSVSITNAAVTALAVQGIGLRQTSTASTLPPSTDYGTGGVNWVCSVDDYSVGTTFADACGGPTPTRTTTWGQVKAIYRH